MLASGKFCVALMDGGWAAISTRRDVPRTAVSLVRDDSSISPATSERTPCLGEFLNGSRSEASATDSSAITLDLALPDPWQVPRIQEILSGRKFWGYLDNEARQSRYVLAVHFVRNARNIVEIGGYRDYVITRFLTGTHDSVSVFSLDAEFETFEAETLNGAPCRVRHVGDYFQNYTHPAESLGVIVLGIEILGDFDPVCNLLSNADVAVIEVPIDHAPSVD